MSFADWLALREPADAAARAADLAGLAASLVGPDRPVLVHDLGSGTGSMLRWLAPRLPGPQRWVLHERDAALVSRVPAPAGVTVGTRGGDLTRLSAGDFDGAALITASALLDMFSAEEIDRVAAACAGRPTLFALSVTGQVRITPADPLDAEIEAAFNDHQRRTVGGRTLLGPDAVGAAVRAFTQRGSRCEVRDTPWRLTEAALITSWLAGWLDAAVEQRPDLAGQVAAYRDRRLAEATMGRLTVSVGHQDFLAVPETH